MHPAQQELLGWFATEHLKPPQRDIVNQCGFLARNMVTELEETTHGPELTAGLRKLLEAKDCFVRASLP